MKDRKKKKEKKEKEENKKGKQKNKVQNYEKLRDQQLRLGGCLASWSNGILFVPFCTLLQNCEEKTIWKALLSTIRRLFVPGASLWGNLGSKQL